jgi:predicted nucleotide-binding protein (sugar kinase/HSP70/actin superfamily)
VTCPRALSPGSGGFFDPDRGPHRHWRERISRHFSPEEKGRTVILFGGLTLMQDRLIAAAVRSLGERYHPLPQPDTEAFRTGKAYGNRGQCNPTYFNVGNLVNYLVRLRDEEGIPTERILRDYCYVTAGGCGPCRFGMYVTEYRKALRDAGFEGFRIFSFEHNRGIFQAVGEEEAIIFGPRFFITVARAVLLGDILNILGYRMRPYETEPGSVDRALEKCRTLLEDRLARGRGLLGALRHCRRILESLSLDRERVLPRVMVIGEFWAAMTEGDGNYRLQRFLEEEGAEVIPQPLVNRLLLSIWEAEYELEKRDALPGKPGLDFSPLKQRLLIRAAGAAVRGHWSLYARLLGLRNYELPDIGHLAELARDYYPLDASGGEGHMEVAHLLESIEKGLAHLVISVKPFGCMPSSAVSDGIQSLVTSRYPEANFLSVETSGEGAVNFYSRIQMALYKAKEAVRKEREAF